MSKLGKCLDDRYNNRHDGNTIWIWYCNNTAAQKWSMPGDGTIRLTGTSYCLDAKWGGTNPGTKVWLYTCNGTGAQQWSMRQGGAIVNPQSNLCLDVRWGNSRSGTPVQLWTCNGTPAQIWTVSTAVITPTPAPSSGGSSSSSSGGSSSSGSTSTGSTGSTGSSGGTTAPPPVTSGTPGPVGIGGSHTLIFSDEFNGSGINWNAWSPTSAAEADCGRGDQYNYNNGQAEWAQADNPNNAVESGGLLTFYAKKGNVSGCGHTYSWSSARISSKASYGAGTIIELRFKASGTNATGSDYKGGTWNGFWTWCADGNDGCEVDGYEFWPPDNNTLNLTSHLSTGTGYRGVSVADVTAWHTMAMVLGSGSIQWYLDGKQVLTTNGGLPKPINLILDQDVCNGRGCPVPGPSATQAQIQFDYVRIWR